MASFIHPTAVVSTLAELGNDVYIGPYCIIEEEVIIADRCSVASHTVIKSGTVIGEGNEIAEGAIIGGRAQHVRGGERAGGVKIGKGNRIRENATIHAAMAAGKNTVVGDNNLIMVNAHIAHDCTVGNNTIIVNNAMLAGHVVVEDRAYVSGAVGIHQFCRVGQYAMIGGQAHIVQDVPPYVTIDGATSRVVGLNRVGLRRNGFSDADMTQLKEAYRLIYRSALTWTEVLRELQTQFRTGPAAAYLPFLSAGKRGFVQERRIPRGATIKLPSSEDRDFMEHEYRKVG